MPHSGRFDGVPFSPITRNTLDLVFLKKKMCQIKFLFSMEGKRHFSH